MFAFLVGLFLFALDNTIVADVQPAIVAEFHSVDKIEWLATAFFLSATGTNVSRNIFLTAALMLPIGRFSAIFNAKWLYILSVIIFEAGSAMCGAAPSMNALIIGRMIAGLGAVGIYTGSIFLISVSTTVEERFTLKKPMLILDRSILE
jgi:MFS family permease